MNTLTYYPHYQEYAFCEAKEGDVFYVLLHTLQWDESLRNKPPRIRLLEDADGPYRPVRCEVIDPWPGAPSEIGKAKP